MHSVLKQNDNSILCPGKHTHKKGRGDKVDASVELQGPEAIECARPAGGHHQRATEVLALNAPPAAPASSKLARHLKTGFCWGNYSATQVNLLARLAVEDHESSPQELQALARLGSSGKYRIFSYILLTCLQKFPKC